MRRSNILEYKKKFSKNGKPSSKRQEIMERACNGTNPPLQFWTESSFMCVRASYLKTLLTIIIHAELNCRNTDISDTFVGICTCYHAHWPLALTLADGGVPCLVADGGVPCLVADDGVPCLV